MASTARRSASRAGDVIFPGFPAVVGRPAFRRAPEAVGREGEATRPFGCAHDGAAELSVDARFRTTCTCSFVGFADP